MGMFLRRGPAPKLGTPIGSLDVGAIVKLNVNGTPWEFLIVHQGLPSTLYDASCDGAWLLMKDIYENRQWNSTNSNNYKASTIHSYLNSTFQNLFDSSIQSAIKQAKIPYVNGTGKAAVASGANGLPAKIFLLAGYELGWTQSDNSSFPIDGACLSYFSGTASTDSKRIADLNGTAAHWRTRSPDTGDTEYVWYVRSDGSCRYGYATNAYGIRPAFILPSDFLVTDDMLA